MSSGGTCSASSTGGGGRRRLLAAVVSLSLLHPRVVVVVDAHGGGNATNTTVLSTCTDDKIEECASVHKKTCHEERCDRCVVDYISLDKKEGDGEEEERCVAIVNMTLQDYTSSRHGRYIQYTDSTKTDGERLELLKAHAAVVSRHNAGMTYDPDELYEHPHRPEYELGLSHLSALTYEEYSMRNGYVFNRPVHDTIPLWNPQEDVDNNNNDDPLPSSLDWVERGAVLSVVDQGACGCCWASAAASAVEGAAAIHSDYTFLEHVSVQQFVSCDKKSMGCSGGYPGGALQHAHRNSDAGALVVGGGGGGSTTSGGGGVALSKDYPFVDSAGKTTWTCRSSAVQEDDKQYAPVVSVGEVRTVLSPLPPSSSSAAASGGHSSSLSAADRVVRLKRALLHGPVVVAINANCHTFHAYRSGVVTRDENCACSDAGCLDRAVTLVGYSDDDDDDDDDGDDESEEEPSYWKIKNSWSTNWGEGGYIRIAQTIDDETLPWGLFGMLGDAYIPLSAEAVEDGGAAGAEGASDDAARRSSASIPVANGAAAAVICAGAVSGLLLAMGVFQ